MKYLILVFILTSCTTMSRNNISTKPELTYAQKMEKCIFEMMNKFAIKAETAFEVCEGIHKGQQS